MKKKKYLICLTVYCLLLCQTAAAQTVSRTPQDAAKALYAAWGAKSKSKARAVADDKAIEKLFGAKFQPKWKFAGCNDETETEKGLFQCVYKDLSDDLLSVAFDTFKTKRGWRVRWLTFGAEN